MHAVAFLVEHVGLLVQQTRGRPEALQRVANEIDGGQNRAPDAELVHLEGGDAWHPRLHWQ
eukprot:1890388-Pyramimonas_sp.AAC.1